MTVAKKTQDGKKKKSKPSKVKKPKVVKSKHEKMKKLKKAESNAVIKKKKKKKSKNSKSKPKPPTTQPAPGPLTSAPEKKKKEKKSKKSKKEEKKETKVDNTMGSGSLKVESTQPSVASSGKKKEEKKKKKEEKKEEKKEPKVEPVPPGTTGKAPVPIPEKKTSNLYNIVGEYEDTKSSVEKTPLTKTKESPTKTQKSPEAKTPETVGPPMDEMKEQNAIREKQKPKEEPKEGTGYDEMKLESDRDNLDDPPMDETQKKVRENSGSKRKQKSESLKLKKTQSLSPVNIAPDPNLPSPKPIEPEDFPEPRNTPPQQKKVPSPKIEKKPKEDSIKMAPIESPVPMEPLRSELDQPLPEPEFIKNHGNTKVKSLKKVNFDLIGRTGMYLERYGMPVERKNAFDWIAYNRHDLKNKQTEFSKNMAVALNNIGINRQLLQRTVVYLKSHGQITTKEMDKVLKEIELIKGDNVSFSQVSSALKKHCVAYKEKKKVEEVV